MSREHKQHNYLTVWLTLLTHSVLAEPFWVGLYGVWARPASHARLAHAGSHAAGQRARFSSIFFSLRLPGFVGFKQLLAHLPHFFDASAAHVSC